MEISRKLTFSNQHLPSSLEWDFAPSQKLDSRMSFRDTHQHHLSVNHARILTTESRKKPFFMNTEKWLKKISSTTGIWIELAKVYLHNFAWLPVNGIMGISSCLWFFILHLKLRDLYLVEMLNDTSSAGLNNISLVLIQKSGINFWWIFQTLFNKVNICWLETYRFGIP